MRWGGSVRRFGWAVRWGWVRVVGLGWLGRAGITRVGMVYSWVGGWWAFLPWGGVFRVGLLL